MRVKIKTFLSVVGIVLLSTELIAEPMGDYRESILTSVLNNPEVNASWYAFLAAGQEQRVARGRYLPRLDLVAEVGHERREDPLFVEDGYQRDSVRLTLTQMLFDGFETRHEVSRLGYSRLARYHELRGVSEQIALEASQAYFDVLRFHYLVSLAEENYVQHKLIYDNIYKRVNVGVGRRVDLEQASGRLALAESNLLTEVTNLHDVSARFLRIVGTPPAEQLSAPGLSDTLIPKNKLETLTRAYQQSPILAEAAETLLAAQAELKAKKAPMFPRLDLRFREELDHDTNGLLGQYDERAVELVMTYNLYNGGSDRARKRQFYQRVNAAYERREKACRDVRQTTTIAFNDIQSLIQQLSYLDRNRSAISKARLAYRKQFDIGQRTLLDLLDTENEYFEVSRAYLNAQYDLLAAKARTLASMGLLLAAVEVEGLDAKALKQIDWKGNDADKEQLRCPLESLPVRVLDKQAVLAKALADKRLTQRSRGKVSFLMDVKFEYASAQIEEGFSKDIEDAIALLKSHATLTAVIEGHADSTGSDAFNYDLSAKRAQAILEVMVDRGVERERLTAVGFGEGQPVSDNATSEGRAKNRRVEMVMQATILDTPLKLSDFAINPK
ncbi:MAG: TolC family outer membrane protein [Spongiibacteraceae bacterium]|nr:TolC family outer membrane protein [Spongiibacteraceae bacterium]